MGRLPIPPGPKPGPPIPRPIMPGAGLGAFIELDYTASQNQRYEHAVALICGNWDELHNLLANTSDFMMQWQNRYQDTPNTLRGKDWHFNNPITIVIEPLTVPSAANFAILAGLSQLYPELLPPIDLGGSSLSTSPGAKEVRAAKGVRHSAGQTVTGFGDLVQAQSGKVPDWTAKPSSESEPSLGTPGFQLSWFAEFALYTRTLTIRYIPPNPTTTRFFDGQNPNPAITQITANKIAHTGLHLLHFDINFAAGVDDAQVAQRRADFVMDWLCDPTFINSISRPQNDLNAVAAFVHDQKSNTLHTTTSSTAPNNHRLMNFTNPAAPSVIIDSVWIGNQRPANAKSAVPQLMSAGEDDEDISPICAVANAVPVYDNQGNIIGWLVGGLLIKSYNDLIGGGP